MALCTVAVQAKVGNGGLQAVRKHFQQRVYCHLELQAGLQPAGSFLGCSRSSQKKIGKNWLLRVSTRTSCCELLPFLAASCFRLRDYQFMVIHTWATCATMRMES